MKKFCPAVGAALLLATPAVAAETNAAWNGFYVGAILGGAQSTPRM